MKGEALMLVLVIQLIVIIGIARIAAYVSNRLGQPIVVGEIVAGLILGPSFLGHFFKPQFEALFPPATSEYIYVLSQIGMIFLLFIIGLEFDFAKIKKYGRAAGMVSVTGIALPFTMGIFLGRYMHQFFPQTNITSFSLFIAAAISITAIPILGRILIEFNLQRTNMGVLTITASAIDDVLGWMCLAIVSAIVASNLQWVMVAKMLVLTALFALFCLKVLRPLTIKYMNESLRKNNGQLNLTTFAILLVGIFGCAVATNLIGIFSLFGPFILGASIYDQEELKEAIFNRLKDFVTVFFLPIFFTYTGLHTDMGSLVSAQMWFLLGALLFVSFFGKTVGCYAAARLSKLSNKEALSVGVMMNTRALMGLIAANLGREMGAITPEVYCMLVIMCAISTIMAWPILRRLIPGTEMGEAYMQSEYMLNKLKTAPSTPVREEVAML